MKRIYTILLVILVVGLLSSPQSSKAQNIDPPTLSTTIEYGSGAAIEVRYVARFWRGPRAEPTLQNIQANFQPQMAELTSNVQLTIGPTAVGPGRIGFGFATDAEGTWELVLHKDGTELERLPIVVHSGDSMVNYFSLVLRPGRTDSDFIMTMLYGPYSTSLRWNITGVPMRPSEGMTRPNRSTDRPAPARTDRKIPDLGEGPEAAQASVSSGTRPLYRSFNPATAQGMIPGATEAPQPRPKTQAGSGSFRRILENQEN